MLARCVLCSGVSDGFRFEREKSRGASEISKKAAPCMRDR